MAIPMMQNPMLAMQAGSMHSNSIATLLASAQPFNVMYSNHGTRGANYNYNPLVASTHLAQPVQAV